MKKKGSGVMYQNPYNESDSMADTPDAPDSEIYTSYDQCSKMQLSQDGASMHDTPNSRSGEGIMGGPAPGEPDPLGMAGLATHKGGKK